MTLRFGTSGIPLSSERPDSVHGIARARELGLDCMEMAWVNGVRMRPESADRIAAAAREHGLALTAHAPYYVNLCGEDAVRERSIARLEHTGLLAARCGAESFCFHAGFYGKRTEAEAQEMVLAGLREVTARLKGHGVNVDVRPELTGRVSQLGSLEHLIDWAERVPGIGPCIDFSHHYARLQGVPNDYAAFRSMLELVRRRLGVASLKRLHVHIAGIEFGPRGERRHLPLRKSRFRYRELLRALKDEEVSGWVVCESPEMEKDALRLQRAYRRLA
jgi:deoxyribonuclease IV